MEKSLMLKNRDEIRDWGWYDGHPCHQWAMPTTCGTADIGTPTNPVRRDKRSVKWQVRPKYKYESKWLGFWKANKLLVWCVHSLAWLPRKVDNAYGISRVTQFLMEANCYKSLALRVSTNLSTEQRMNSDSPMIDKECQSMLLCIDTSSAWQYS
jgi:hypothetical protein